jgi:hypothetical protein
MQHSSVSNRENSSQNTQGMVWSTNTRIQAITECGRHFTDDRGVRLNKLNRPAKADSRKETSCSVAVTGDDLDNRASSCGQ